MVISSLSVGLLSLIVLSILDVKYVVSNALIAMVLNVIPNIGPVISGIFPISIALLAVSYTHLTLPTNREV